MGRSDDVISSAGYRIGPFDVESCLLEHDAVAESAVVGKPDDQRGEIVVAYVVLHEGYTGSESLIAELTQHVRDRLGKHAFPREITLSSRCRRRPAARSSGSCCATAACTRPRFVRNARRSPASPSNPNADSDRAACGRVVVSTRNSAPVMRRESLRSSLRLPSARFLSANCGVGPG